MVYRVFKFREYIDSTGKLQKQQTEIIEKPNKYEAEREARKLYKSGNDKGTPFVDFGIVRSEEQAAPSPPYDDVPDMLGAQASATEKS